MENSNDDETPVVRTPVVDSVLTFCVSVLFNSSSHKIVELMSTHFCLDEIKQSKTVLCDVLNEHYHDRRTTDTRTDKYAHSQDVMNILQNIDKEDMPYFVIDAINFIKYHNRIRRNKFECNQQNSY